MTRGRGPRLFVLPALVLAGALAASACVIVPLRVPTRIEAPDGTRQALPAAPVVPGTTTRQEVEERYKAFAVAHDVPNLFWGRFLKSSWAVFWAVGWLGYGDAGGGRTWGSYNVLVTFDDQGSVKSSEVVPDRQYQEQMARATAELRTPPVDFTRTILIEGPPFDEGTRAGATDLELRADGVVVTRYPVQRSKKKAPPPPRVAVVPLAGIERVEVGRSGTATTMDLVLRFTAKTEVGRRVTIPLDLSTATLVVRWWQQVGKR